MNKKLEVAGFSDEEIARRYEATLKRVLTTPPQHRTAKGDKANPPKKRGRPKKVQVSYDWSSDGSHSAIVSGACDRCVNHNNDFAANHAAIAAGKFEGHNKFLGADERA
jgi:hypothetical protein